MNKRHVQDGHEQVRQALLEYCLSAHQQIQVNTRKNITNFYNDLLHKATETVHNIHGTVMKLFLMRVSLFLNASTELFIKLLSYIRLKNQILISEEVYNILENFVLLLKKLNNNLKKKIKRILN